MAPIIIEEVESPQTNTIDTPIQLSELETTLRRLLLDVAHHIDIASSHEPLVLRFTGGWVRDKLLGVPSHDIDVAINNMTGYQFGLRMKEYLDIPGNLAKYGLEGVASTEKQSASAGSTDKSKLVGGLHKIEANPEKSKHLETVTTRIFGLDIDLVNLRKESYTEDSRNPQMEFGTPEEDALRRDATVNAMFYNLSTQEIEDLTHRGHNDMQNRILRTPLEPYQTFKDDPLRVLRLIRFASRLGWTIDADALTAMRHDDIKDALRRKISRERVGIELEKALRGPDPHEALKLILDINLYDTIFCDPAVEPSAQTTPDLDNFYHVIDMLDQITDGNDTISDILLPDAEESFLAWQLAAFIPYRDAPLPQSTIVGRKPPPPIATRIAREGIKSTSKICEVIGKAVLNVSDIRGLVDGFNQQSKRAGQQSVGHDLLARDYLGMQIRSWGFQWRSQVMFALLADIADQPEQTEAYLRRYTLFLNHLRTLDLLNACTLKPLIDGKQLAKAMSTAPGPWMKDALEVVIAWQLRNPGQTNIEEAIQEVQRHGELAYSLAEHVLKLTIRPLFNKSRHSNITNEGRRRETTATSQHITADIDDDITKPWKKPEHTYVLSLFSWSIKSLDEQSVQRLWPLTVPTILTLIDDWEFRYKQLGCSLLDQLLKTTPTILLERTGLGPVFQDALEPCLALLPPLLKDDESITLLPSAYEALITLAERRYTKAEAREDAFDVIIRKGIIYGFAHTSQRPAVVQMLLQQLTVLINKLGIASVKHLKFILPMLTEIMANPLSTAHMPLLRTAAQCVHAVIRNGWPRMVAHRGEILKAVTLCWLNLFDVTPPSEEDQASLLKQDLQRCVDLLRNAVDGQVDFDADFQALIVADVRLEELRP